MQSIVYNLRPSGWSVSPAADHSYFAPGIPAGLPSLIFTAGR
jgi:hypothetical protein